MPELPIEPNADQRVAARELRAMFLAPVEQGFTEPQAMQIIAMFAANQAS